MLATEAREGRCQAGRALCFRILRELKVVCPTEDDGIRCLEHCKRTLCVGLALNNCQFQMPRPVEPPTTHDAKAVEKTGVRGCW